MTVQWLRTANIKILPGTTIQMQATAGHELTDAYPLDDVSGTGAGPYLVLEKGIYKYPQQDTCGRITIPTTTGKPVRVLGVMGDLGAASAYTIWIKGIDNTAQRPDNSTGFPYSAANKALYREGDIQLATGAATRYLALNYNMNANDHFGIIFPGQDLVIITAGASSPLVRVTFAPVNEWY